MSKLIKALAIVGIILISSGLILLGYNLSSNIKYPSAL
jgi:hypothetical protein